jgi:tRNA (cmo5U34)-methyltransferase
MEIPREWTFERKDIAEGFDLHVREQLPFYDMATGAIAHIARHYIPERGLVYDIGASTGNVGNAIAPILDQRKAKLVPIESSAEMCELYAGPHKGHLLRRDALEFDFDRFDLAICFLVMMFFPVSKREAFIAELREKVRPGGAIIIFDKTEAVTGYPATILMRLALAGKLSAGVKAEEIIAKELSLGGVQRPLDPAILGDAVEWFRFGDFAGWIIEG